MKIKSFFVFLEVFLILSFSISTSYLIGQSFPQTRTDSFNDVRWILENLGEFLKIKQISSVSAYENIWKCCPETKYGARCVDIPESARDSCKINLLDVSCKESDICAIGCCIDPFEKTCTSRATKQQCLLNGGIWKPEENCRIPECKKGCCVLGNDVEFTTKQRCEKLSEEKGFIFDFRAYQTEDMCLFLKNNLTEGACILNGACRLETKTECIGKNGTFYENMLCSNPSLNTSCKKQAYIGCVEGKDEIYWFDSCGNRENIYSADKNLSWNNGYLLSKYKSCNILSNNAGSENCGNCDSLRGSICSKTSPDEKHVKDGNYICKSLKCIDENGKERENGESWCVYDGYIGDGKDVVGSRHWRRICVNGHIKTEPCADYRGQICAQSIIKNNQTGKEFSQARCVSNEAIKCLAYNENMETMPGKCLNNSHCILKEIKVSDGFKFKLCTSKYPRGFDLTGKRRDKDRGICSLANQKCIVVYQKKLSGWKCIQNCECETKKFFEQMNDLCISLGDCGSYVNILGEGSNNVVVTNSPKGSWEEYKKYATPVPGQYVSFKNLTEFLNLYGLRLSKPSGPEGLPPPALTGAIKTIGEISGGVVSLMAGLSFGGEFLSALEGGASLFSAISKGFVEGMNLVHNVPAWGIFGTTGLMLAVASLSNMIFKLQGDAATVVNAVALTLSLYSISAGIANTYFGASWAVLNPFLGAAIILAFALTMKMLGVGETKKIIVKFECHPWEAPVGGDNCEKCNEDPLKPCSEYRCTSLGQACGLINPYKENPECKKVFPDDGKPPLVNFSVMRGYLINKNSSYEYIINKEDGSCIPEFTPIIINLTTNKFSQCKWDFKRKENSEDMDYYVSGDNGFLKNHIITLFAPSLESVNVYNISGNFIDKQGRTQIFIRCQDRYGNYNIKEYSLRYCVRNGPDSTPPILFKTSPENNTILPTNKEEINLSIWLNEPAECKFSSRDKNYSEMEGLMNCSTGLEMLDEFGWRCSAKLSTPEKENKFYIRCRDKPWLGENSTRNINQQPFVYVIRKTENPLKIDYISLSDNSTITLGPEKEPIDLEVRTKGGINNGESVCLYGFKKDGESILMSGEINHHARVSFPFETKYIIYIKCVDSVGNIAKENRAVHIKIDSKPPEIIRIFKEGANIKFQTNEPAKCYVNEKYCYFDLSKTKPLSEFFLKTHYIEFDNKKTYYIKCKDAFENENPSCAVIINPEELE